MPTNLWDASFRTCSRRTIKKLCGRLILQQRHPKSPPAHPDISPYGNRFRLWARVLSKDRQACGLAAPRRISDAGLPCEDQAALCGLCGSFWGLQLSSDRTAFSADWDSGDQAALGKTGSSLRNRRLSEQCSQLSVQLRSEKGVEYLQLSGFIWPACEAAGLFVGASLMTLVRGNPSGSLMTCPASTQVFSFRPAARLNKCALRIDALFSILFLYFLLNTTFFCLFLSIFLSLSFNELFGFRWRKTTHFQINNIVFLIQKADKSAKKKLKISNICVIVSKHSQISQVLTVVAEFSFNLINRLIIWSMTVKSSDVLFCSYWQFSSDRISSAGVDVQQEICGCFLLSWTFWEVTPPTLEHLCFLHIKFKKIFSYHINSFSPRPKTFRVPH